MSNSAHDIFTCKVCNNYFGDPVLLTCGENICREHVDLKTSDNDITCHYKCQLCNNDHEVVKNGFCSNIAIMNLFKLNFHLDEKTSAKVSSQIPVKSPKVTYSLI